jgi:hypothetical protein
MNQDAFLSVMTCAVSLIPPLFQDDFNLTGLNSLVPYYDYALDMVLDVEMPMEDSLTEEQQEIVESAAVSTSVFLIVRNESCSNFVCPPSRAGNVVWAYSCTVRRYCELMI